jgi:hypothetical protein
VGPCGAARIGYGDSVLNEPDSRRLSVMVACEWSHVRCEWSLTQRPRVGRSLGPGAGGSARARSGGIPSPQAERRNPRTGDRGDFQFAAPGHDGSRTDEDLARRMYACTHNSNCTTQNSHTCCGFGAVHIATAHPGRFCVFQRT